MTATHSCVMLAAYMLCTAGIFFVLFPFLSRASVVAGFISLVFVAVSAACAIGPKTAIVHKVTMGPSQVVGMPLYNRSGQGGSPSLFDWEPTQAPLTNRRLSTATAVVPLPPVAEQKSFSLLKLDDCSLWASTTPADDCVCASHIDAVPALCLRW